jgi:hypothetical protein
MPYGYVSYRYRAAAADNNVIYRIIAL